jgi:flavin-dependent trigonelline monooxygenase, oxygenase component
MRFAVAVHVHRQHPEQSIEEATAQALEFVTMADELGFEVAWAAEHHAHEYYIAPNPLIQLTHWAAHTRRIRLGTAVIVAPYWHPLRLAGEIGMTDVLTGGRLEIGIARGAFQYEFDRMLEGMPQELGREYVFEIVPVIKRLWAGDYEHHGKHWRFPAATATPKPLQQPHPPLWVAARDPQSFDFAVKHDLGVMSTPLRKPLSEVENLARKLDAAVAANPGHRRPRWTVLRPTCVYEHPADWWIPVHAMRDYQRLFEGMFRNASQVVNGFPQPISEQELDTSPENHPQALHENMLFGTSDQVVAKLGDYEALGVDLLSCNLTFGLPHEVAVRSLRLFAERVMPHFAGPHGGARSDRSGLSEAQQAGPVVGSVAS